MSYREQYENLKNVYNFFGPIDSEMGRIDMSIQFEKAQTHENQFMKRFRDIYEIFKKISKLLAKNIETLSQKQKVKDTFSSS